MLKTTLSTITALLITATALNADVNNKSIAIDDIGAKKGIIVEATEPTPAQVMTPAKPSNGYGDTIVYARSAKSNYRVGEPIKIQLKLKRDAFIYFWTVSANGNGYLILPNNLESYNRYKANTNYVVPERSASYEFVSDRAGVEQVFVLATNKKISTNQIKAIFNQRAGGVIPKANNKSIRNFVTKDIVVIAKQNNMKYDIASFKIGIQDNRPVTSVNITVNP
jgi:hypothetical protein